MAEVFPYIGSIDLVFKKEDPRVRQALIRNYTGCTSTDNAIPRFDGTEGKIQASGVTIDDSNNLILPADIYSVDWTAHSPTWTGFDPATPDNLASVGYKVVGDLVVMNWIFHGNSNTTDMKFTLPYTAAGEFYGMCRVFDSGTATYGEYAIASGDYTRIVFYKNTSGLFTNSGDKGSYGWCIYRK